LATTSSGYERRRRLAGQPARGEALLQAFEPLLTQLFALFAGLALELLQQVRPLLRGEARGRRSGRRRYGGDDDALAGQA